MNKWAFTTMDLFILCGLYFGIGIKAMYLIGSWQAMASFPFTITIVSMTFFVLISIIIIRKGRIKQTLHD